MEKIIIAKDPEQAAKNFVADVNTPLEKVNFSLIPKALGADPRFWAKLVQIEPRFIARVPEVILKSEAFAGLVDHAIFYRHIPKKYLTEEDFQTFKANPKAAVCAYGHREKVSSHDTYVWYRFNKTPYWYSKEELTANVLFNNICENEFARDILPELWSQELADKLWNSSLAVSSFDTIPQKYVREEWKKLLDMFIERRNPVFGRVDSRFEPEKLAEYWSTYKSEEEMQTAIQVEELIRRCFNPHNYSVILHCTEEPNEEEISKEYLKMWETIEPTVATNPQLIEKFFQLYGQSFSRVVPEELFNLDWITHMEIFEEYVNDYKKALDELDEAKSRVEVLQAREDVGTQLQCLRKLVKSFRDMDDESIYKFIDSVVKK